MPTVLSYRHATFASIYIWTSPDKTLKRYWACFKTERGEELNVELTDADAIKALFALNRALSATGNVTTSTLHDAPRSHQEEPEAAQPVQPTQAPAVTVSAPADKTAAQRASDWLGKPDDAVFNGLLCSECCERQFQTSSGISCKNGHGGAAGKRDIRRKKLEVDLFEPDTKAGDKARTDKMGRFGMDKRGEVIL